MTVKEFINELDKFPEQLEILFYQYNPGDEWPTENNIADYFYHKQKNQLVLTFKKKEK